MELTLNRLEENVLLLHMSLMRKPIKKGFKKRYEKDEAKKLLKIFGDIHDHFKSSAALEEDTQEEETSHYFIEEEIEMMLSFLSWYCLELQKTLDEAGEVKEEDRGQLETLISINRKVEQLKVN